MMPYLPNQVSHYLILLVAIISDFTVIKILRDLQKNLSEILKLLLEHPDGWSSEYFLYLSLGNLIIYLYQIDHICDLTALFQFYYLYLPAFPGYARFPTECKCSLPYSQYLGLFIHTHMRHLWLIYLIITSSVLY